MAAAALLLCSGTAEASSISNNSVADNSVSDNSIPDNTETENSETDNSITNNTETENSETNNSVSDNSTADNSIPDNTVSDNSITDNTVLNNSISSNSIPAEDADWIEIADFQELSSIINGGMRPQTRHIRLTADIIVAGKKHYTHYIISPEYAPIYIDTGEFTIYVEGELQILGNAQIFGKGGEEGLVHIRKGGHADIQGASLRAEEGYAIWQEDGAYFSASDLNESTAPPAAYSCEGECRYPDKPVVWDSYEVNSREIPYRIIPSETAFAQEQLPTELYCVWSDQGKRYEGKLPVFWEMGKDIMISLQERERTLLKGNFGTNYDAAYRPYCMLAFQRENAAVIVKGKLTIHTETNFFMELDFVLDNFEEDKDSFYVIFSEDGKVWQRAEQGKYELENGIVCYSERFEDGRHPPVYFCIGVEKGGRLYYSDIVMMSEDNILVRSDIQGGRGGGTSILPGLGKTEQGTVSAAGNSTLEEPQTNIPVPQMEPGGEETVCTEKEQGKEAAEGLRGESTETFSGAADFGKTEAETGLATEAENGRESMIQPAGQSEDMQPDGIGGQNDIERKRQIFMGFCSIGIILAAVFAGDAFFHSRSR